MISDEQRQKSSDFWFGPEANKATVDTFIPSREDEPTILEEEATPEPVKLGLGTRAEDVIRNEQEPEEAPQEFTDVYSLFASPKIRESLDKSFESKGFAYKVGELFPKAPRGIGEEFGAGISRGIDQTQAMGFGLIGLMGEALGVEAVSDFGVDGYLRNMEEAAKNQASVQDPFEEIGGVGDAGLYAAGILGEQLPQLLLSVAGGGIGGFTAKTVAKKVVANEIGKRVAAGMAKDEAEKVVSKLVAQKALMGFANQAETQAIQQATKAGAISGAYAVNTGQIAGGSFGEIEQETGLRDPINALGFALIGGAVETAGEAVLAAPIARKLIGSAARSVEAKPLGFNLGPKAKVAGQLAAAPAAEGATEYVQTGIEQSAVASADPNRSFEEVVLTPEAARERQIAAAAGAVGGGGFGAVSQAASFLIPETRNAVQRKLAQRQADQGAAEEEQSAAGMLTGEWSQPVQVDDVTMQRNSSGVWVAVNPGENLFQGVPRVQTEDGTSLLVVSPEADEQGRAAFLVARAEKALSDLDEGEVATEFQSQEEPPVEADDELGEPVELDEETEATRLRQSPMGATALREQLAEEEEVSAALADPVVSSAEPPATQPLKSAAESAETIAAELEREEEFRRSDEGAQALRAQLAEEEEVSAALADPAPITEQPAQPIRSAEESARAINAELSELEQTRRGPNTLLINQLLRQDYAARSAMQQRGLLGERLGQIKEAQIGGDQEKIILQNFYQKRRKDLESARDEQRKITEAALARPSMEAAKFVDGLKTGDRVGLIGGQENNSLVFVGRRKNGNAVFESYATSPVSGDQVGSRSRLEFAPSQFKRIYLAPPPQPTRTPLEQSFDDALGPNPTKQQAERVLGSPYTGTRGAQESTFQDGLGSEPFPVQISWFNKKGEKGTIIPSIKGKFTNSPLTTVRQMNQGLEIVVPDDQLGKLSKDIQVESVSDKKGGRKNIVTGVNLWGRTYRRSLRSPKDFSVDIPLTKRGANARKQGLLVFDNIYKNSPERIARSEAAMRGAQERKTPMEDMLREWELVQAGLNPVEYAFYEDALARVTEFINRSNLSENVKDEARFEAQNNVVKAFANRKKRRGKQPAEGSSELAKLFMQSLDEERQKRLNKVRERATRLVGNIESNPDRMSDVEIDRARGADPARGPVLGSVGGRRSASVEEAVLDEAQRGNEVDINRAINSTLDKLAEQQPKRSTKEVMATRKALFSIAQSYKNLGKFNPTYTAMNAVQTADRSIRRREMNEQTDLITDREARELAGRQQSPQDPATTQEFAEGELDLAQRAETVQSADRVELPQTPQAEAVDAPAPEADPDAPMTEDYEAARERLFSLSEQDRDLLLRFERQLLDERGRPIRGQKSNLTQAQKKRARLIKRFLIEGGADLENQINEDRPRTSRGQTVPATTNLSGRSAARREVSGANASIARGRPATATQGRPEGVVGSDSEGAGTVPGASVRGDGRPGVRASLAPQTVRQLSRAAKFRFVQSVGRLTDAEAAVLTEAEIDRAYEAVVTRKQAAAAQAGSVASSQTPRSLADLGRMSGSELLAGAVEGMRAYEADRYNAMVVRENIGALLRTRAFADVSTFLNAASTGSGPQDVKLRAREFSKLLGRGVDLNAVGVQIGRFGADTSWAGFFTRHTGDSYNIAINLDALHDRDSAVNTMLHELSHVVTAKKLRGEVKLNNVERNAVQRLEALRREAIVAAAKNLRLDVPKDLTEADYTRLTNDFLRMMSPENDPNGNNRVYVSLTNLEEFTVEMTSNPELAALMARLGFGEAKGKVTLLNAIRDAWNALVELISGVKADPNSPLAKAFKDSWILNYSNAGADTALADYTMPEIRRSAINREQARLEGIERYIDSQIEARNLAGTTEERNAILEEMFDPSTTDSANKVQDAANRLSEEGFVQWARDNGYNFVDPVEVYYNNRTPEQAARNTVQAAESRARGRVNPPVPSKAEWEEEIGEELVQANTILKGKAPLKLIKVRDDLDYDTSYISGTHIFKTPEGDIITASKEDGQWEMQSIFNGEISTIEEDSITNALERLSEELAEKRMMLAGEIYDEFIEMPKDHPFWSSELARMDLNDAPKIYRMIDYYRSLPKQPTNESSPDIRFSLARGRVWRPITKTTPTGGKISQGGMFSVDELLDVRAGDAYRSSRMAIKADVSVIQELSRQLERQMKNLYKGQTPPLETINTALGNLENPLTTQQLDEIEALVAAGRPKQAGEKKDQFLRENRKQFKEVTQPAALAQLPEDLAATIREMSAHVESLSRRLPNEGLVNGDLAISVDEALGTYLNRSYAIFDDPKWVDSVRKNAKVMDAARKFIRSGMVKDKANELIVAAQMEGRTVNRSEALAMANDSVTDDQVEGMLESYLAIGDEAPSVEVLSGRIPGQKNLSIFYKRGNIAPEIQALWGRYEDPTVNYAKTVMKLSSLVANDQFLKQLRDTGLQEGWLWSRENNPDDLRHPPGYVRISTDNNPTLAPIGGMYAHPMLAEGLFKMFPVGSTEEHYWWLRSAMKLTGISMGMKTVGSVASQIRNYLGNYLNLVAGGNFGLGDIASGDFAKRFQNSTDTVLANTFNKYRNASRAEWRAKIDDYIRRGVVGESITTGLLEDLLTASRRAGSPDWGDYVWGKVSEPVKRVADFATRTYSAGDDWFKVMIYEAEQDKYRKAYPDWSDDQVKQKAAKIARDIHWTYSLAPAVVQDLKKFPFVAPFVTFTTEVIRTSINLTRLARQEIMEGRATGNKELENIGWKRVRGMATAAFLPAAVGSASMALAGISDEDEEDLRRFLPDWQKNNQLLVFRKEDGQVSFLDVSFLDPYEYFKKPLVAFARSLRDADSADDVLIGGTMAMVRQAVDPFTSEQIFAGAIMDVMRNRDAAGRQVYNPQDTGANIGTAVARKIFIEPFTPGTFTSLDRISKAAFGVQSESGRAYGLFNELASVMAGQRVSEMDAQQALQFKGSGFMREIRDASALFNKEFVSRGTRSASDVVSGYDRANAARRSLIQSIRTDYLAAIRLGVPVQRAKAILRDAGLGRDTLKMVTSGIYKPFEASEQSVNLVRSRGESARISAYNNARREVPQKEILP